MKEVDVLDINKRIKARRIQLNLTLKDVADALGVAESTVSRYETSDIRNMGIDKIKALANGSDIIVTGFVDEINVIVSECCLNVAPVRVAAGIQNKVLVAMGCGVPVVMSSLISKAIPELINNENCMIEDDKYVFAEKPLSLGLKEYFYGNSY